MVPVELSLAAVCGVKGVPVPEQEGKIKLVTPAAGVRVLNVVRTSKTRVILWASLSKAQRPLSFNPAVTLLILIA